MSAKRKVFIRTSVFIHINHWSIARVPHCMISSAHNTKQIRSDPKVFVYCIRSNKVRISTILCTVDSAEHCQLGAPE